MATKDKDGATESGGQVTESVSTGASEEQDLEVEKHSSKADSKNKEVRPADATPAIIDKKTDATADFDSLPTSDMVKLKFKKNFDGHGVFEGVVESVRNAGGDSLFRVVYTDGDSEDLTYENLKALVTPDDLKAHLEVVRKHDIRTWMAGRKTSAKGKSSKGSAEVPEPQLIDMTSDSPNSPKNVRSLDKPSDSVKNTVIESDHQKPKTTLPAVVVPSKQDQTPIAKTSEVPPTSVVAFFSRGGENKANAKDAKTQDDETFGVPRMFGKTTVVNFGNINSDDADGHYHTSEFLYPIGFKTSRFYSGYKGNPLTQVMYTSEIFVGKDGPMFRVTAADDKDNPKLATSASGAWKQVHDCVTSKIAEMKLKLKKRAIPGHDHFGLKNSKIAQILEKLPGALDCKNYIPLSKRVTTKKAGAKTKQSPKKAKAGKKPKTPKKTRVKEMSEAAVDELKAMIESQETKVKLTALVTNFHASHSNIPKKLIKAKIRQIAKYKNGTWSCGTSADSDNKGESKGEGVASKTSSSDKKSSTSPSVIDLLAAAPKAKPVKKVEGEGVTAKTSSSEKKSSTSPSVIDLLAAAPKAKPKPAKKVTKAKAKPIKKAIVAKPVDPRVHSYEKALKEVIAEAKQILSSDKLQILSHPSAPVLLASFQSARASGDLTLELLDQHLPLLALVISGSELPFSTLSSRIHALLKSAANEEATVAAIMLDGKGVANDPCPLVLRDKIVSLAKRVACAGAPRSAVIREDTSADCVWVWQVTNTELLPDDAVVATKKTWGRLSKCISHANSIRRLVSMLKNGKCKPGTISKAEEAVANHVRRKELARQREQNRANALKLKEEKSRKRKLEQAAKVEEKKKKKKLALEEKERKKKLALEEKLKKKQAEEAKAKAKKEKEKKKKRGMRSLFSFFSKKTTPNPTKKVEDAAAKSKKAKYSAPSGVENALAGSQTTSIANLLGKATSTCASTHSARESCASKSVVTVPSPCKRARTEDEVEIVKVQTVAKRIRHNKFFQFEEDRRPPFFGLRKLPTFESSRISGRRPLQKDYNVFNYDIDSDDEWECANGESLSGSDDEPEDADPKEDEFRYDGWLCGDNQIDWIQEGDAEEGEFSSREDDDDMMMDEQDQQDEADGTVFKPKQNKQSAHLNTEVTFRLVTSIPGPDSNLRNYKAQALVSLPYIIGKPFDDICYGKGQKSKYVWTKDDSRALATCFIGGKEKISKIVTEFHDAHQKIPKTQINDNARAMTVYERRAGDTRKYWYLTKESKAEYDIQEIDAPARGISAAEDLKALAQHIHGQKGFARLVVSFREKHSKYSKREIEVQIKQMTVYEKRGADTRLNYYLTKELQEKYGIKDPVEAAVAAISVEDLKSLAQHIHGQPKSIARLVDEFHEKYSQYLKRNIEAQIKQMTKYEKRGADTRLKYYLSKELQEKYGIKDRVDALAAAEDDLKALAQHVHGQKGIARLVVSFREKHSKYSKREIEVQIKQMTKYEKRGADTRLNYYLTKELQEKYGIKDPVRQPGPPTPPAPKSIFGTNKKAPTNKTPCQNKNVAALKTPAAASSNKITPDKPKASDKTKTTKKPSVNKTLTRYFQTVTPS